MCSWVDVNLNGVSVSRLAKPSPGTLLGFTATPFRRKYSFCRHARSVTTNTATTRSRRWSARTAAAHDALHHGHSWSCWWRCGVLSRRSFIIFCRGDRRGRHFGKHNAHTFNQCEQDTADQSGRCHGTGTSTGCQDTSSSCSTNDGVPWVFLL